MLFLTYFYFTILHYWMNNLTHLWPFYPSPILMLGFKITIPIRCPSHEFTKFYAYDQGLPSSSPPHNLPQCNYPHRHSAKSNQNVQRQHMNSLSLPLSGGARKTSRLESKDTGRGRREMREQKRLDLLGIEPKTFSMQSRRATTALQAHPYCT